MSTLVRTLL